MQNEIQNLFCDNEYIDCEKDYIFINNPTSIKKIYDLFFHDIPILGELNDIESYYYGIYYNHHKKDYNEMKKYYLMAIEKGNVNAIESLAYYYRYVETNYDQTKKYYLMAFEKGNMDGILLLADYYSYNDKKYHKMEKYYLMAIEKGNDWAMLAFGDHCKYKKYYKKMEKYYLMAIEKGNERAMHELAKYYEETEKKYDLMEKYYLMAIEKGNIYSMESLADYYYTKKNYDEMKKYYLILYNGYTDNYNRSRIAGKIANYYQHIEKNYDEMKKYYFVAIMDYEYNDIRFTIEFANYYRNIEKDYNQMKKYYLMAINRRSIDAMIDFADYYQNIEKNYDEMEKYYLMAFETIQNHYYSFPEEKYLSMIKLLKHHYKNINQFEKYYILIQKCRCDIILKIAKYYHNKNNGFDKAKKYYLIAIEKGDRDAIETMKYHYKYSSDYTLIDCCKQFPHIFNDILNEKFNKENELPKEFYQKFCNLNFSNNNKISSVIKYKQYILKMTNIFPKYFSDDKMILFMELLSISKSKNNLLPKDIIMKIAGHLFS